MANRRLARISRSIRDVLAELLLTDVRDPGIQSGGVVTIREVEVSADWGHAKVWLSATIDGPEEREQVLAGFERASRFMRLELGHRLRLKRTPLLHFFFDDTEARAWRIEALLRDLDQGRDED